MRKWSVDCDEDFGRQGRKAIDGSIRGDDRKENNHMFARYLLNTLRTRGSCQRRTEVDAEHAAAVAGILASVVTVAIREMHYMLLRDSLRGERIVVSHGCA